MTKTPKIEVTQTVEVNTIDLLGKWLDKSILPANSKLRGADLVETIQDAGFVIMHRDKYFSLQDKANAVAKTEQENKRLKIELDLLKRTYSSPGIAPVKPWPGVPKELLYGDKIPPATCDTRSKSDE